MKKAVELIRPTQVKIMPPVTLIIFSLFWAWIARSVPADYLWRSLVIHVPLSYLFTCLFFWFAKPSKKQVLTATILLSLVCLAVSFSLNALLYKGLAKAYQFVNLSEINPKILSCNLRWNAGLFIFLFFLCSSYMWIYFCFLKKKQGD